MMPPFPGLTRATCLESTVRARITPAVRMELSMSRWHVKGVVACLAATSTAVGSAGIPSADAARAAAGSAAATAAPPAGDLPEARDRMGFFDAREAAPAAELERARRTATDTAGADLGALRRLAGVADQPLVSIDAATGTPDNLTSLDSYLTGTSKRSPREHVEAYQRRHPNPLGLEPDD